MRLYQYRAVVTKVVDGDTVWLDLDLGLRIHQHGSCRLAGIDAPEMSEIPAGATAKEWLTQRLLGKRVAVRTTGLDKYGRPVVTLWEPEPLDDVPIFAASVNQEIVTAGQATLVGAP